ncbi:o-succinylbenzoate synthase [Cyclobacterium xiamenense]|jgi:o-succinylbenzoate synthase|uniref:o-succinylbenzoate synthase n=1 Tax=Cyclobacterium xiamenense TaxID=1297121 RepID=UPI0012B7F837|nr:o-succinylbenzoate synthase [Cyclobacterium xiamenense]
MVEGFKIHVTIQPYTLVFTFDAGTSRGVLRQKQTFILRAESSAFPGLTGLGEAGPLKGLSPDDRPDFLQKAREILEGISDVSFPFDPEKILQNLCAMPFEEFPSLRFGLETAILDLFHGGKRKLLSNPFYDRGTPIPINGLIWMGDRAFMKNQIEQKLLEGYNCIKMKIGAIDFELELALLEEIRTKYSEEEISLRVDANGAFGKEEAMHKLERLGKLGIHSIEQPIAPGNPEAMEKICSESPVPVALDEELIGIVDPNRKKALLDRVRPAYLILKPTLLGGMLATKEWIQLAEQAGIGWWMTSALESNIGLNAVAQFTSSLQPKLPQGLGTGTLYRNNFPSPLRIASGKLHYESRQAWELPEWLGAD